MPESIGKRVWNVKLRKEKKEARNGLRWQQPVMRIIVAAVLIVIILDGASSTSTSGHVTITGTIELQGKTANYPLSCRVSW